MKALGNFRGTIVDAGVAVTSGGYPQLVAKVHADQMYDEEEKKWFDWSEFEWDSNEDKDRSIVSYNVLFGKKGCTLSGDQVKKITGWEGDSFASLAAMDLVGMKIQWRNEEDTYDGKTKVQVSWIDLYDAEPGGTVRKLDDKGIKDLDAKFAEFLTSTVKAEKAPAGGRRKAAAAPAEEPKKGPNDVPVEEPKETKPKTRAGRPTKASKAAAAKAAEEKAAKSEPPSALPEAPAEEEHGTEEVDVLETSGPCTKQEAWADVNELKSTNTSDSELAAEWLKQIKAIAPGKEHKDISGEEWGTVRAAVLDATATF